METINLRNIKMGTDIPFLILEVLENMKYPRITSSVGEIGSVNQDGQKMLYVLHNIAERFLNFETKYLTSLYVLIILNIKYGKIGWSYFQCAINFLIVPAK